MECWVGMFNEEEHFKMEGRFFNEIVWINNFASLKPEAQSGDGKEKPWKVHTTSQILSSY